VFEEEAVSNMVLLLACLVLGIVLRASGRLPDNAPATLNGFIVNVALPALVLAHVHGTEPRAELIGAVLMPWLLFIFGVAVFWLLAQTLHFSRGTTGALMMLGGLGNTSFVGLPMIESFYGSAFLSIGILIDQLGTYLVLSTLGIAVACLYSESRASPREIAWRIATFPPLLAMLVALALTPFTFPEWISAALHRLGGTLAPLALISVGMQLRRSALADNRAALATGLGFKLFLGPAILVLVYAGLMSEEPSIVRVTLFESAMAPQIGASIVAIQYNLNPALVTLMVGIGTLLSFVTLPLWWLFLGSG
jgi:predicted permease